ncbi:MAG TPA: hypothetical protein GX497_04110 [Bacillus bacterium]|nr:hypothetical protein [Bacillus sp. (in: firmicutes)]
MKKGLKRFNKIIFSLIIFLIGVLPAVEQKTVQADEAPYVKAISAGGNLSLALKEDGMVVAWGNNQNGQTTIPNGLDDVKAISAGNNHSLALKSDGTVVAWGDKSYGNTIVPNDLGKVEAISAGFNNSLALKEDGTVAAWGNNQYGQTTVPSSLNNVVAISAGGDHSLALKSDGTVVKWGPQTFVPSSLEKNTTAISAGLFHSLALKKDGTVVAWGNGGKGQTTVPNGLDKVVAISAGGDHSLALKSDGTVVAWGDNYYGQSKIPAGLDNVVAISAGRLHSLALKSDGTVVAWGDNYMGQSNVPTKLAMNNTEAVTVDTSSLLIGYGGTDNADGVTQNMTFPISGANGSTISWVSNNTMYVKNDGTVTQPTYSEGDHEVTLTATISRSGIKATKEFTLMLLKQEATDEEAASSDKATLKIGYGGTDNPNSVTQDVILPTSGSNGTTISWVSSDPNYVSSSGQVTRPSKSQGDRTITLTATISKNGIFDTKDFTLKVLKEEYLNDMEAVTADTITLTIGYGGTDHADNVTQNLVLPTSGSNGTTISWASSNPNHLSSSGQVTRPTNTQGDQTITLVATISRNGISDTKVFTIKIIKQPSESSDVSSGGNSRGGGGGSTPITNIEKISVGIETAGLGKGQNSSTITSNRTTKPNGTKQDEVDLEAEQAKEIVKNAKEARQTIARIMIPDAKDEVSQISVNLTVDAVKDFASGGIGLEFYTENVQINLPAETLVGLNKDINFKISPIKGESGKNEVKNRAIMVKVVQDIAVDGTVQVIGRPIIIETNLQNRPVDVVLPLRDVTLPTNLAERQAFLENLAIFIEHDDGESELIIPEIVEYKEGQIGLKFRVTKFSTFTILNIDHFRDEMKKQETPASGARPRPYIIGFPDGTFKPEASISRAEMAAILSRVEASRKTIGTSTTYPDVASDHWAYEVIQDASTSGLMKGFSNGTFRPNQSIIRGEVAAILSRWLGLSGDMQSGFKDSLEHWTSKDIALVGQAGLMKGMANGEFQPNKPLTRAEAVAIFNRALKRAPLEATTPTWQDVPSTHWAFKDVEAATNN